MDLTKPMTQCVLLMVAMLLVAACANQMKPAQQALDGVDSAVSAAAPDAGKYMPDALTAVQGKATALKASFDKGDYRAVLIGAPAVLADAKSLAQVAAAKKEVAMKALGSQWADVASSLPKLVETVKARVDALSKARHLPKGVDLAAAKSALADATGLWAKAQAAFTAGQVEEAVNNAKDGKARAEAAAAAVKLNLSSAAAAAK
jgi:hypothetical protein